MYAEVAGEEIPIDGTNGGGVDSLLVDPNGVYGVISNSASPNEEEINVCRQDPDYGKIKEFESSVESRRHSRFRDNIVLILIIVAIVGVLVIGI